MYISPSNKKLMKLKNYSIHPAVYFIVASLLIAYFFHVKENSVISSMKANPGDTDYSPLQAISLSIKPMLKSKLKKTAY